MTFAVQMDKRGLIAPDFNVIREAIEAQNWYCGNKDLSVYYSDNGTSFYVSVRQNTASTRLFNLDYLRMPKDVIPIGSVEFVENWMQRYYGLDYIKPILIPTELSAFLNRPIAFFHKGDIKELFHNIQSDTVFVKNAERVKSDFEPTIIALDTIALCSALSPSVLYMASQPLDILSEWRCFVFNHQIRDIRPYAGNVFSLPDKNTIEAMVQAYRQCKDAPRAYTLDVAVTQHSDGVKTTIIEVHNFIACGLYGFEDFSILPQMVSAGFHHEVRNSKKIREK